MLKMTTNQPFTSPHPLRTAVLFLVFNRLDTTKQVFAAIRSAKPPRLYIASDGPRVNQPNENESVKAVRDYVIANIDWPCQVKTFFQENNLGCKYAVSGAITWFFKNEERGIILEDDCLPNQSFFWFCEELLEKYHDDLRIWHISGNNFQNGAMRGNGNYYFSSYSHIWGWASWANRWEKYDVELSNIDQNDFQKINFRNKKEFIYWLKIFEIMKKNGIDTWDYQWNFTMWINSGSSILPNKNLVSNIGFGNEGTHTKGESNWANMLTDEIDIRKCASKMQIISDKNADEYTFRHFFAPKPLLTKILERLKGYLCAFLEKLRRPTQGN